MKYCLTLDLKDDPKLIEEYKQWHSPENIWKEIPEGIRKAGIQEMEIFLWHTRLFMIIETSDGSPWEKQIEMLSALPTYKKWELLMDNYHKRLENTNDEGKWQKMERIFKLTDCI